MKGLLIKDFLELKSSFKLYFIIMALYSAISIFSNNFSIISAFIVIFCVSIPASIISLDERSGFDKLSCTMPLTRKDIVISKYVICLITHILSIIFCLIMSIFIESITLPEKICTIATMTAIGIFYQSVIFPLLFKFGTLKSRQLMIIVYILPAVLTIISALTLSGNPQILSWMFENLIYISLIIATILIMGYIFSINLSIKIYEKKDL